MKCLTCGKNEACHRLSTIDSNKKLVQRNLCCTCYVMEGNPPADWHKECMEARTMFLINKYGYDPKSIK